MFKTNISDTDIYSGYPTFNTVVSIPNSNITIANNNGSITSCISDLVSWVDLQKKREERINELCKTHSGLKELKTQYEVMVAILLSEE